ncbi:3-oxo-tetronate kinase [Arthrobacter sp. JSM 101049]|uniref:3-oxo-tetronate kinase n=1 Tax=Arthrobacter sp. JSM 101049 TaxID=929097 RepID=UPI0035623F87
MGVQVGVIADDFTGATDIAGFLTENGFRTILLSGIRDTPGVLDEVEAVVISLKSRSNPVKEAVQQSLDAMRFLNKQGINRFFFKYCSTFDSTPNGNIGPVTDALLGEIGEDFTVVCPALPVNGRTIYKGYLFVGDVLLQESGMRDHPVTPMRDSNLMRLMEVQAEGKAGNVPVQVIDQGPAAVRGALTDLRRSGVRYAILDAVSDEHLHCLGEAVADFNLVTGGSGLGGAIARALNDRGSSDEATRWTPLVGRTVILSGSSSVMTNLQVENYVQRAPAFGLSIERVLQDPSGYVSEIVGWVLAQPEDGLAPIVYATGQPEQVRRTQEAFGADVSGSAFESLFAALARALRGVGATRFIVAGGETSGSVTTALGVEGFRVGPQVAPGVPWVRSLEGTVDLVLKSGNFGEETFFTTAQK